MWYRAIEETQILKTGIEFGIRLTTRKRGSQRSKPHPDRSTGGPGRGLWIFLTKNDNFRDLFTFTRRGLKTRLFVFEWSVSLDRLGLFSIREVQVALDLEKAWCVVFLTSFRVLPIPKSWFSTFIIEFRPFLVILYPFTIFLFLDDKSLKHIKNHQKC